MKDNGTYEKLVELMKSVSSEELKKLIEYAHVLITQRNQ